MSKMTKPTVDVVRFAASDVIVASGKTDVLKTFWFGDPGKNEGYLEYNGIRLNSDTWSGALNGRGRIDSIRINNPEGHNYGDANRTISDLFIAEYTTDESIWGYAQIDNGTFTWNGSSWVQ